MEDAVRKRLAEAIFEDTELVMTQADALALKMLRIMRSPTEAMKSAALDQYGFNEVGHWTAIPARVYESMIDTAIAEG